MQMESRIGTAEFISLLNGEIQVDPETILGNAYLQKGDALVVGGSLIEGIGNRNSDIDVYVLTDELRRAGELKFDDHFRVFSPQRNILTPQDADEEVYLVHTVLPGQRIKVDIEYKTWDVVEAIADSVVGLFEYAVRTLISLTAPFDRRDLAFVHRMYNSIVLSESAKLGSFLKRLTRPMFQYLMFRWKVADYSALLDLQGAWKQGDLVRCADLARENMVTQFHAHTHLCGNTNYHRKWILSYALMHDVDAGLYERYVRLLMHGPGLGETEIRRYIHDTLDFVDQLFEANSHKLALQPLFPSGLRAIEMIDAYRADSAGDYSQDELAYAKKSYGEAGAPTRMWFP